MSGIKLGVILSLSLGLIVPGMTWALRSYINMEGGAPYYSPVEAKVVRESLILWRNSSASPHTVTHKGCMGGSTCAFDSGVVAPDQSFTISGLPPGRYQYICRLHPIMQGELIVLEDRSSSEDS